MDIDKFRVGSQYDGRKKLTEEDKEEIKTLYFRDKLPIREIARQFEGVCSRRLIQFVLFPERLLTVNYSGHWKKYYNKEEHKLAMRKHRSKKIGLVKDKKIN